MRDVGYRQQFCNGLLMNPLFAINPDIRHIRLAWSMLRRAGASSFGLTGWNLCKTMSRITAAALRKSPCRKRLITS